jgi:hypothetical protein
MIRTLVNRLNEYFKIHSLPSRQEVCVPVTISIKPELNSVRCKTTGKLVMQGATPIIKGETKDLSENGIAFIVACIRVGQNHLVGEGKTINVVLDLPNGKVHFQALGQRYQPLGTDAAATKYLVGARIVRISETDRKAYEHYLRHGCKAQKAQNKSLALGIPNS